MTRAPRAVLRSTATILRHEFVGLLRSEKGFWIAILTVAGTALIPLLHWPAAESPFPAASARAAFSTYRWVARASLGVFVPLVAWASIRDERRQDTLVLLLSTPLRPAGIVLGKLLSTAGYFLLLVVLTFPMAAVLFLLGGSGVGEFAEMFVAEGFLILGLSIFGLAASAGTMPGWSLFTLGTLVVMFVGFEPFNFWRSGFILAVLLFNALKSLGGLLSRRAFEIIASKPALSGSGKSRSWGWPVSRIMAFANQGIPDGSNPIFIAGLRSVFPRSWNYRTIATVALTVGPPFMVLFGILGGPAAVLDAIALLASVVPPVIGPGLASELLIRERERGALELLRATPLGAREILFGKLQAALMIPLMVLGLGGIFCGLTLPFFVLKREGHWVMIALFFPVAFSVASLQAATAGLLGGALSRTGRKAMVLSYLFALGSLIALPLLTGRMGLSPLTTLLSTGGLFDLRFLPSDLVLSVVVGLSLAGLQFLHALVIFETTWLRES